ncbi:hypothetical protein AL542_09745 [Grimontia hollisae]|nr:hypothetical protein AL542_09745 [Grimontia hollisae]
MRNDLQNANPGTSPLFAKSKLDDFYLIKKTKGAIQLLFQLSEDIKVSDFNVYRHQLWERNKVSY